MSTESSQDILNELTALKKYLNKLNSKYYGPFQSPHSSVSNLSNDSSLKTTSSSSSNTFTSPDPPLEINNTTLFPFILLLGNHSAGKSSFINQLFNNKEIQETSLAPLDDCFTIISSTNSFMKKNSLSTILKNSPLSSASTSAPSSSTTSTPITLDNTSSSNNIIKSGEILVNDPDLGFKTLKQFGKRLVDHTKLKLINNSSIDFDFMIVDTPGMIDSAPTTTNSSSSNTSSTSTSLTASNSSTSSTTTSTSSDNNSNRGYDFPNVINWYADRADVILLFFDPEKPGTTYETLKILENSLRNHEEKLFFILNKIDNLKNLNDLLRVYGTLTWNLSKVLIQKELPKIFTICLNKNLSSSSTSLASSLSAVATNSNTTSLSGVPVSSVENNFNENLIENNTESSSTNNFSSTSATSSANSSITTPNSYQEQSLVTYEPNSSITTPPLLTSTTSYPSTTSSSSSSIISSYFNTLLNDLTLKNYNNILIEIFNAPKKRLDNEINYFHDIFLIFLLHYKLYNKILLSYKKKILLNYKKYFYITIFSLFLSYSTYNFTDYLIQYNQNNDFILTKLLTNSSSPSSSSTGSNVSSSTSSLSSNVSEVASPSFFSHFKENFMANLKFSVSISTLIFSQAMNSLYLLYNTFKTNKWLNQFTDKNNHRLLIHKILIENFSPSPSSSTSTSSSTSALPTSSHPPSSSSSSPSPVVLTDFTPYIIDKTLNNVTFRLTPKLFKSVKFNKEEYEEDKKFLEKILYEEIPKIRRKIFNFNTINSLPSSTASVSSGTSSVSSSSIFPSSPLLSPSTSSSFQVPPPILSTSSTASTVPSTFLNFPQTLDFSASSPTAAATATSESNFSFISTPSTTTTTTTTTVYSSRIQSASPLKDFNSSAPSQSSIPFLNIVEPLSPPESSSSSSFTTNATPIIEEVLEPESNQDIEEKK